MNLHTRTRLNPFTGMFYDVTVDLDELEEAEQDLDDEEEDLDDEED